MTQTLFSNPVATFAPHNAQPGTSAASPYMVQLKEVTKTYGNGVVGLQDISLRVRRGDFLFIMGHSGSGKSTLIKLLYGEERPDRGAVIIDSLNVGLLWGGRLSLLRRRLGIVFQDYRLIPRRTVAENVALVLRTQGVPRPEIHQRLQAALEVVGLQHKAACFPEQLSGGEQQRASIARAIVGTPDLLLADEPTGNLDPDNAQQVMRILQRLNSVGITVMVTTHNQAIVQASNHPVVYLQHGCLLPKAGS